MQEVIVRINGTDYLAKFDPNEISYIYINDIVYQIELLKRISPKVYSFSVNQKMLIVEFDIDKSNKVEISLDGFSFDVLVTNETRQLLEQFIKKAGMQSSDGAYIVKAPMPGMVVKVNVVAGQLVKKGDKVIIVEAMKMENSLAVQTDGIVKTIKVKEGQAVDKDTVLIELEEPVIVK